MFVMSELPTEHWRLSLRLQATAQSDAGVRPLVLAGDVDGGESGTSPLYVWFENQNHGESGW